LFLNPSTSKYPVALGDLVLNSVDGDGVEWVIDTFDGWGSTVSTVKLTERARGDGATTTDPYMGPRTLTIVGQVTVVDPADLSYAEDQLIAAVTVQPFQLSVAELGRIRWMTVQRQGEVIVKKLNQYQSYFSVQLAAKDPFKYGDAVTVSTGLPSSTGGLTYPVTYPVTYTGVSNSGVITVNNPGNAPAPVFLRVDGAIPAGGWSVNHLGQGTALSFATSLALGAGEFVTVDLQRREVLAQGQSTRNGYVTSRGWFQLDPGVNQIAFSAVTYDPSALLTLTTYPAWS
jgi:hypothetical protein